MTDGFANNDKVFGRWQPRMLETSEMAEAFMALLNRPGSETDNGMFELMVDSVEDNSQAIDVTWNQVKFNLAEEPITWSADKPLRF
tara:strand:- start:416 stop:673 length:258 start_codon:yes stop_codon:yes gene_type:complete